MSQGGFSDAGRACRHHLRADHGTGRTESLSLRDIAGVGPASPPEAPEGRGSCQPCAPSNAEAEFLAGISHSGIQRWPWMQEASLGRHSLGQRPGGRRQDGDSRSVDQRRPKLHAPAVVQQRDAREGRIAHAGRAPERVPRL